MNLKHIKDFADNKFPNSTHKSRKKSLTKDEFESAREYLEFSEDDYKFNKETGLYDPIKDSKITDGEDLLATYKFSDGSILSVLDMATTGFAGEPVYWLELRKDGERVNLEEVKELLNEEQLEYIENAYTDNQEANASVNIHSYIY